MESDKYSSEYQLSNIDVTNDKGYPTIYESNGRVNPYIMKRILRHMDDEGNYSIDDSDRRGTVDVIIFTKKNGEEWFEYSPSHFIKLGRPLKVIRTIEDKVIEEV